MRRTYPAAKAQSVSNTHRSIYEIVTEIFSLGRIDRATQQLLMSALLEKDHLSSEDEAQVNRVFMAVNQGRLRIVD